MSTQRACQARAVGYDVITVAGLEGGDSEHWCGAGIDIARHDLLQCANHLGANGHRIDTVLRHRPMAALAANGDIKIVAGRHISALFQGDHPHRAGRENVQTKNMLYIINDA